MVKISSTITDELGGILFLMEVGGPMQGISYRVDEWAEVVGYYVDGCIKVDVYQIDRYMNDTCYHVYGWAQMHIKLDGWAKGNI
jgi:hypothetical protein